MDCNIPGFPVHYQRLEIAQTHIHGFSDATQPSHPLSLPSPPAFNLSQYQGLFWVSSSHQVTKILKLKFQYFGHLMRRADLFEKTLMLGGIRGGRDWGQEENGMTEDEMVGWHHWLNGRESEWTLGVDDGQGGLVSCDSWGHKESAMTERLNWTELTELSI